MAQIQEDGATRPLAYASRTLQKHEQNYVVTELEALGVVWAVKHFRPYLYGHRCDVCTDHEALKSLLNTPQPSGKLARWGMAIQELDLHIHYRPGKVNANVDALSRAPADVLPKCSEDPSDPCVVLAALRAEEKPANSGDDCLEDRQRGDLELAQVITYLETGVLPEDHKRARELALSRSQYTLVDGVLYRVENDKTLRIIPPRNDREKISKRPIVVLSVVTFEK